MQNDNNSSRRTISKTAAERLLFLVFCLSLGFLGGWAGARTDNTLDTGSSQAQQQIIASESQLINKIAKDVGPSVVSVNVTGLTSTQGLFGPSQQRGESAGTGVIISTSGVIITNRHVVPTGTEKVTVTLSDGTELTDVSIIGRTNDGDTLDVAFLKVNNMQGKKLKAAVIADSSKVQVGDKVVAIGNALGQFQNTVTSGIISGFGRNIEAGDGSGSASESLQNLFQTDTAINRGNSGGPLVNTSSQVIGINTAVAGGDAENIGFSIPINDVQGLIKSVLKEGKLLRPYLGVRYVSLTDDYAYQYNLSTKRGAYLAPSQGQPAILKDSPASKAGLKEKDVITKIDGVAIDESNSLTSILGRSSVGDTVSLTVIREGKTITVKVTLEAVPEE